MDPMRTSPSLRNIARRTLGPQGIQFVHRNLDRAHAVIQAAKKEPAVRAAIARSKQRGTAPKDWFCGIDDETWLWTNTVARRRRKAIADLLPQMPAQSFQENFTGQSGDLSLREGFNAYKDFQEFLRTIRRAGWVMPRNYGLRLRLGQDHPVFFEGCRTGEAIGS